MNEYVTAQGPDFRKTGMTAVYLAGCALNDRCPELDVAVDLDDLFAFCKFHSITAIVAMALERYWKEVAPAEPEQMKQWKQAKDMAIRKNILLNAERDRILKFLESIDCWYMPLKGSLLQFDYPKFGMRQMSDNDILVDPAKQEQIHDFMCENQYTAAFYKKANHDEYMKKPVYYFEMHMNLFEKATDPVLAGYYEDVKRLLRKDPGNKFGFHLSDNDFYVYLIAHAYKHVTVSGIGLRHLLDVYVYLNKHGNSLDREYLRRELEQFGAYEFTSQCEELAQILFREPQKNVTLREDNEDLLDAFLQSGTYGTKKQLMEKSLANLGGDGKSGGVLLKLRYLFRRIFPPVELLAVMHPEIKVHKWKIPFVYAARLWKALTNKPKSVIRELKALGDENSEK